MKRLPWKCAVVACLSLLDVQNPAMATSRSQYFDNCSAGKDCDAKLNCCREACGSYSETNTSDGKRSCTCTFNNPDASLESCKPATKAVDFNVQPDLQGVEPVNPREIRTHPGTFQQLEPVNEPNPPGEGTTVPGRFQVPRWLDGLEAD